MENSKLLPFQRKSKFNILAFWSCKLLLGTSSTKQPSILFIVSYASLSKIQQEFICKPHAVLGQGVLIFQTTASNYMNEDIDHSFLVPSACIRSHSCFSSEFSFELPLGNIRTFFKCHLFWSQGVSQLQGDGVMDAWNNVKILGEKFWFDDNFAII